MNNLLRITLLSTATMAVYASPVQAAPFGVITGENMVMLPYDPNALPAAPVQTAQENMVMLPEAQPLPKGVNYVESGVNWHNVSDGQGDWFGQFLNAQVQSDEKNRWNTQILHQKAFHETGTFVGVGNNHTFDDRWSSDVSLGMGDKALFLPRYRADAALNRRWLEGRNLITTTGVTWTKAPETYRSVGLFLAASYYFPGPWIAQAGVRADRSTPGGVYATSGFGALTYGYAQHYLLTARAGYSREAYQLTGPTRLTNAFNSQNVGLNWRQWIGDSWGYNIGTEFYHNPAYDRLGGSFSLFKEF